MRILSFSPLLATALLLGACGPVNRGVESVNQPVVARTDYVFDLSPSPTAAEQDRLGTWFDTLRLGYGDRVSVDDRSGYGGGREAVAAVAARYGILLSETAPVTEGSANIGGVRVIVSRSSASVPNCPNWSRPSQPEYAGSTMSNFGCANNSNLAAMIANPEDLVQGRDGGKTDATTTARAIKFYRDAEPTGKNGLKNEKTGG
jgi:pilus assembly protein CpaD